MIQLISRILSTVACKTAESPKNVMKKDMPFLEKKNTNKTNNLIHSNPPLPFKVWLTAGFENKPEIQATLVL